MSDQQRLADRFEPHRGHLHAVAYRMLGDASAADDAVQETWLRLARSDVRDVENLAGWLTTVVSRICLDLLRARKGRREQRLDSVSPADPAARDPEQEPVLADSVGLAMLIVLDRLDPAERVAFVLHDVFAVPFSDIAPIVDRTPATTKKLASRARGRVRGVHRPADEVLAQHRQVVERFLVAARSGDLGSLLDVLAPDVVRRADPAALPPGAAAVVRGARGVAENTVVFARMARYAVPALVDGAVGAIVVRSGRLAVALRVTVDGDRVSEYEVVAEPDRLERLDLAVL
ncbi:sigma-70 family RNA polymerase sigma factor [Solicola gregarius]|uniref:Sigma-70 family RNA polymerase sigma factor n=1 Tax=Solicola gregarius TaxID=2908642 RepID=A0AA46TKD6_9ACTN|nr:sigma-70 family RNA polymerase sigma factor [Solicola gregarius]UYM06038.1 sigma-70 family RNA polymerase sigma factor [Solicola gregarius]